VYREREKEREKEEKNREKTKFVCVFFLKKLTPAKKIKKNIKIPSHQGDRSGLTCHPGVRVPI
jgi:hypothetical protein